MTLNMRFATNAPITARTLFKNKTIPGKDDLVFVSRFCDFYTMD